MQAAHYVPRPGDTLLCYDHTFIDKAVDVVEEIGMIRQGIRPPNGRPIYSHAAVCVGNGYIIEALGDGLQRSHVYDYFGKADVWSLPIGTARRQRIVNKAEKMLQQGYKYSWWDLVVQFMYLVFGVRIPWDSIDSIICSVFAYDCWAEAGERIAKARNCAPEDIAVTGVLEFMGPL